MLLLLFLNATTIKQEPAYVVVALCFLQIKSALHQIRAA